MDFFNICLLFFYINLHVKNISLKVCLFLKLSKAPSTSLNKIKLLAAIAYHIKNSKLNPELLSDMTNISFNKGLFPDFLKV